MRSAWEHGRESAAADISLPWPPWQECHRSFESRTGLRKAPADPAKVRWPSRSKSSPMVRAVEVGPDGRGGTWVAWPFFSCWESSRRCGPCAARSTFVPPRLGHLERSPDVRPILFHKPASADEPATDRVRGHTLNHTT